MEIRVDRKQGFSAVVTLCLLFATLVLTSSPANAKSDKVSELYRANAMVPGAVGPGAAASVDIKINRFSTDAEEEDLRKALKAHGPQGLHKRMKKHQKTGFVAIRGERGYPTYYTQEIMVGGKRNILILTDREIYFEEVYNREISTQFPFTMIMMELDDEGTGQGTAILGAELIWDEAQDALKVTGYSAEPIRLEGIKLIKKK
jgi:hypothetical protein